MTRASDLAKLLGAGATINDGTTITTADNTNTLSLISTDADASTGPNLVLQRDSASPADNDLSGTIKFIADNDAAEATDCVSIFSKIIDASNGSEDASLLVNTIVGGSQISRFNITPTEISINDDSIDSDFRVESNANINMLLVDSGGEVVTIGGLASTAGNEDAGYGPLQVGSTATNTTVFQFLSATDGYGTIHFGDATSGAGRYAGYIQYDHNDNSMTLGTNGTSRLAMANDGQVNHLGSKSSYYMWSVENSHSGNCGTYRSKTSSSADNTSSYHFVGTTNADRVYLYGNGNIVNTNNSYGALSDEKLKENIVDSGSQWEDIKAVKVRKFSLKEDNLDAPNKIGVIAQELEASNMGGLVYESPDRDEDHNILETSTKQVHYSILYMKAIKALQEAMAKIETQETSINDLQKRITALESA
jgi:hypothetical protein